MSGACALLGQWNDFQFYLWRFAQRPMAGLLR
jgi:hypothetical protein